MFLFAHDSTLSDDLVRPVLQNGVTSVAITDNGFEPSNILIPTGTTVQWINKSTRKSWPASNPHPTHTDYPHTERTCNGAFDACRALEKDAVFSFQFTSVGSWQYHDHLFPSYSGSVKVIDGTPHTPSHATRVKQNIQFLMEKFLTAEPSRKEFMELSYNDQRRILEERTAHEAWNYLKNVYVRDGTVRGNAHELAHVVGNMAYQENGFSGVAVCDPTMSYGCYHGVSEAFLLEHGESAVVDAELSCQMLYSAATSVPLLASCIHGMGHGIVSWTGLDLTPALALCDTLLPEHQKFCYDGVFMEYLAENQSAQFSVPEDHLWDLCTTLPLRHQESCTQYQILEAHRVLNHDITRVLAWCEKSPIQELSYICLDSLGRSIGMAAWQSPNDIVSLCSAASSMDTISICIAAAAEEVAFQKYAAWEQTSDILCKTLIGTTSDTCTARIQRVPK